MGATQGKSKKEQKEEAREWAITKENEVAQLYAQNTELRNQILMMQEDMRALRDMLKGQQSALNESVKQVNERMTEMENDVKVVPFCGSSGGDPRPLSSISSPGEQEVYYRNQIDDGGQNYRRPWDDEKKRKEYSTSYMWFGRVYSLKQFEKVYVDELKFKKITANQYGEKMKEWQSQGCSGYLHGLPQTLGDWYHMFPRITNVPNQGPDGSTSWFFKRNHVEPDEE
jgi:hypothetical protein